MCQKLSNSGDLLKAIIPNSYRKIFYREVNRYKLNKLEIKTSKSLKNRTLNLNFIFGAAELIIQIKKIVISSKTLVGVGLAVEILLFFCPVFNEFIKTFINAVKVKSYSMIESEMEYRGTKSLSVKKCVKAQRVDGS